MSKYMTPERIARVREAGNTLQEICHGLAVHCGWYHNPHTGELIQRNDGEQMMLMVSEIAEAMEANRKNLMDSHLPHRLGEEAEISDAVIREADYCGKKNYSLGDTIAEKLVYNENRPDHKPENRVKAGGKAY